MENEINLGTEKIHTLFIKIVIPSIIAMLIIGAQGMIDGLFLGSYVNSNAMASVNITIPFSQIAGGLGMIISIGGTSYIGRMLGAENIETAESIFKTAFITLLVGAFIFLLIGLFFSYEISLLLGANEILLEGSSTYIKIQSLFLPFLLIYFLASFSNRIIGKPQLFLIGTLTSIVANILLNFLLIAVLDLKILGAGLATGISYTIGFLINIPPLLNRNSLLNIYKGKFNFTLLKKMFLNGSSEGITSMSQAVSALVFNLTFMHYYGELGVSAFTIISYVAMMSNLIMFGLVDGVSPIISYNFGANLNDRVKQIFNISLIINIAIGIISYIFILLCGETLIGFYAKGNTELIELTYAGAKIYGISFLICGVNILVSSYFTAIGEALKSVIVSASRGLIFILIGISTLPYLFGVTGVWLVSPFSDLITLFISFILLKKVSLLK